MKSIESLRKLKASNSNFKTWKSVFTNTRYLLVCQNCEA